MKRLCLCVWCVVCGVVYGVCRVEVRPKVLPLWPRWAPLGRIGVPMWAYWHPLGAQWVPTGPPLWPIGAPLSPTWGPIGGPKRPVRPLLPWREHALHGGEHALHDHQKLNDVLEIWRNEAYALLLSRDESFIRNHANSPSPSLES